MTTAVVTPDGTLRYAGRTLRAALGRGGVTRDKQEGDGATPAGILPLRRVMFRADRIAALRTSQPRAPIAPHDGWCDDALHPDYNRLVRLPHDGRCETLWRQDGLYDVVGILGWNDAPVQRGRGSAIFLHVASPDLAPTEGCVALPRDDLLALLADGLTTLEVTA